MSTLYISTDYTETAELLFPGSPNEGFPEAYCLRQGCRFSDVSIEEARKLENKCGFVPMSRLVTVSFDDRRTRGFISTLLKNNLWVCEESSKGYLSHGIDSSRTREKMLTLWLSSVDMQDVIRTNQVSLKFLNQ